MRTSPSRVLPVLLAALCLSCATTASKQLAARRALGLELVKRGDYKAAFDVVRPILRERPRDAEALTLRGIIYTDQRLLAEAVADLEQAVKVAPKLARAHSALGIVYDIQGRSGDALVHHRRATHLVSNDPGYLNNLGFSLFASGRPQDAIPVLHEALRGAPTDARIRNNLGFAYAAAGDLTRAAEQLMLAGPPAQAKNNLGFAYERRGALSQAYELYAEALRIDPALDTARANLVRVARTLGRDPPPEAAEPPLLKRGGS